MFAGILGSKFKLFRLDLIRILIGSRFGFKQLFWVIHHIGI